MTQTQTNTAPVGNNGNGRLTKAQMTAEFAIQASEKNHKAIVKMGDVVADVKNDVVEIKAVWITTKFWIKVASIIIPILLGPQFINHVLLALGMK